jgi:hypothetical protein
VTQMMSTPPSGENYGSGNQADHPRRRNGARSHARPGGTGEQPRPAYPQDVRQASGSYPAGGYPGNGHHGHGYQPGGSPGNGTPGNGTPGNGSSGSGQPDGDHQGSSYQNGSYQGSGYQGSGHPGDGSRGTGHRAPRDPRDDYRRLTHRRLPGRLESCPRETWSGRPPAACTRRWRGGR